MTFEVASDGKILGLLPDGKSKWFDNIQDYENAFWDMQFELNNGFDIEWPECL